MITSNQPRAKAHRRPLVEVTESMTNARHLYVPNLAKDTIQIPDYETFQQPGQDEVSYRASQINKQSSSPMGLDLHPHPHPLTSSPANPRLSAVCRESQSSTTKRTSQFSTASTTGSDGKSKRKTHIGPWHLGKTLGKGSTARVRFARHAITGQLAAVKIVPKDKSKLTQLGSLASLNRKDLALVDSPDGIRRMPYGIEREIAIMKLINHPHIMKLYDIWENRTEIYMVIEYVENGELFEHIAKRGRLPEEEAMVYFRQIISAVGYCHSFNICHRDLKPENVLLDRDGSVKIADFGMAAIHQTPEHKLRTSCGSPHYAAPEVVGGQFYRGDKVDVWSIGVILFASLAGCLPFDHPSGDIQEVMALIKICDYEIPGYFSDEAADLVYHMLQLNPKNRINISQIWTHPLLRKYDYLDPYGGGLNPQSADIRPHVHPVIRRSDIDREVLRHLRSLWHMFDEPKIVNLLLNDEPNDQKLFYSLLVKHREVQLESFVPDVGYSSSDYHHVRPLGNVPRLSSRQFTQPNNRGHGRQISRFTVISNVTKADTVMSYDPFRESHPQTSASTGGPVFANIVVHRGRPTLQEIKPHRRESHNSSASSLMTQDRQQALLPPRPFASRSSLASSTRSRASALGVRVTLGNKRAVSFAHLRKVSKGSQKDIGGLDRNSFIPSRHSRFSEVTDDDGDILRAITSPDSTRYVRSRKIQNMISKPPVPPKRAERSSKLWQEDVRQLSSSLAKDCDEAFNRTSLVSTINTRSSSRDGSNNPVYETPLSSMVQKDCYSNSIASSRASPLIAPSQPKARASWIDRPLPAPPSRSESISIELAEARKKAHSRRRSGHGEESPGYLDRMVSHIDRLIQPGSPPARRHGDRRVTSAPVNSRAVQESCRPLPSIVESPAKGFSAAKPNDFEDFMGRERVKHRTSRVTSAPEARARKSSYADVQTSRRDNHQRESIRVVLPSSPSPIKAPAPLNIRKKSSQGSPIMTGALPSSPTHGTHPPRFDFQQQYARGGKENVPPKMALVDEHEESSNDTVHMTGLKKSAWFKRNSKSEEEKFPRLGKNDYLDAPSNRSYASHPAKKKGFAFGRIFGKYKENGVMSVSVHGFGDDSNSITDSITEERTLPYASHATSYENPRTRQIEPQRTWIARLFHVKPATKYLCFSISNRRARQEITYLLRDWKKYGARDVVVDKDRNIVFGRVAAKNYLHMKEVSFASEILTVVEHGKRGHLSIARFTQERGAASSLDKVVDTLEKVFKSRGLLVSDKRKQKMMIKTLNS